MGIEILSYATVFDYPEVDPYDPGNRYGYNHAPSITKLKDGRLLCVWFSGPYEASVNQVILCSFSEDKGRTWNKAKVIVDSPMRSDFDPAFITGVDRTWLFYSSGRHSEFPYVRRHVEKHVGDQSWHLYHRFTDDAGKSWSEPQEVGHMIGCRSNGIRLSTGELILPVIAPSSRVRGEDPRAGVLKSNDSGETWHLAGRLKCGAGVEEPTVAELLSGELLIALRTLGGHLWTAMSGDKGESWREAVEHDIEAACASHNLFRISDGRVILVHDEDPSHRTPLTIRITEDGSSWSDPVVLAECTVPDPDSPVWDRWVTYPSTTDVDDGTLVIVWTDITEAYYDDHAEQSGIIRSSRVRITQ